MTLRVVPLPPPAVMDKVRPTPKPGAVLQSTPVEDFQVEVSHAEPPARTMRPRLVSPKPVPVTTMMTLPVEGELPGLKKSGVGVGRPYENILVMVPMVLATVKAASRAMPLPCTKRQSTVESETQLVARVAEAPRRASAVRSLVPMLIPIIVTLVDAVDGPLVETALEAPGESKVKTLSMEPLIKPMVAITGIMWPLPADLRVSTEVSDFQTDISAAVAPIRTHSVRSRAPRERPMSVTLNAAVAGVLPDWVLTTSTLYVKELVVVCLTPRWVTHMWSVPEVPREERALMAVSDSQRATSHAVTPRRGREVRSA
mmetsp:Transcript_20902/g.48837  ORF Transcript_20902/g.48837 Transcript_20902/m.48837 type:complete len:314 (-) Transcript_20902:1548-2489(-)